MINKFDGIGDFFSWIWNGRWRKPVLGGIDDMGRWCPGQGHFDLGRMTDRQRETVEDTLQMFTSATAVDIAMKRDLVVIHIFNRNIKDQGEQCLFFAKIERSGKYS